jgi:hypothetical protein
MNNLPLERMKRQQHDRRVDKWQRLGLWVLLGVCVAHQLSELI